MMMIMMMTSFVFVRSSSTILLPFNHIRLIRLNDGRGHEGVTGLTIGVTETHQMCVFSWNILNVAGGTFIVSCGL